MEFGHAEITVKSKINCNSYHLFDNEIIVCKADGNHGKINLPNTGDMICFYDMYYASDGLRIVIATRKNYDLVAILDEDNLTMGIKSYTK